MLGRQGQASDPQRAALQPDTLDEAGLIRRVVAGEPRAFETLYRIYHPRLSRFLTNILRRPHLVEEALNDTLMVVWKRPESFNGTSKVSTWIFAIAYRKTLKALRKWDEPIADDSLEVRPSLEPDPEQQVSDRQVGEELARAMGELSAEHRTVISLACFDAFNYREVAEIVGCPVETVKTRMFYARRRLRKTLSPHLGADA